MAVAAAMVMATAMAVVVEGAVADVMMAVGSATTRAMPLSYYLFSSAQRRAIRS